MKIEAHYYEGNKFMLRAECGCTFEWQSDPSIAPRTYPHQCAASRAAAPEPTPGKPTDPAGK